MPLEPKLADLPRIRGALRLYQVASDHHRCHAAAALRRDDHEVRLRARARARRARRGSSRSFRSTRSVAVNLSTGILIAHGWFYVLYLFSDFRLWSLMRWRFPPLHPDRARRHHPLPVVLPRGAHRPRGACIPRLARVRAGFGCRGRRRTVQHPRIRGGPAVSETQQPSTEQRPVLVVDFGAQYAQLIARRVREASVYSEIVPHTITAAEVAAKNPVGIVLSGGPSSVYEAGAPALDEGILRLGVPTLGICYGFQVMAQQLGGEVAHTGHREYGSTAVDRPHRRRQRAARGPARGADRVDEPRRLGVAGARGLRGARLDRHDPRRSVRERRAGLLRRAVAPRGQALGVRPAGHRELPAPCCRHPRRLELGQRHRRAGRPHPRAGRVGARASPRSRAGSTRPSRPRSCRRPSATS